MKIDRLYLLIGLCYAIVGMLLGIYMAASNNHTQHVTHAHILLLGFVVSIIYAVIYKLWLEGKTSALGKPQFYLHQAGTLAASIGLFLLYGRFVALETIDPVLALASLSVLAGAISMLVIVKRSSTS